MKRASAFVICVLVSLAVLYFPTYLHTYILTYVPAAQAAGPLGFSVSESLFDVALPPGAEQEVYTVVFNQSNTEALPVHVELTLWSLNDDTDQIEFTSADEALNAVRWFKLAGKPDFILQPASEHEVWWNLQVPPEAPAGSYLVMARFVPALPEHYFTEAGPRSVPELGVLFFIKVVPLGFDVANSYQASITSFIPQGGGFVSAAGVYGTLANAFQALIRNDGLYFFKARGTVTVTNWWGRRVAELALAERYLMPGNTREVLAEAQAEGWFKRRLHFGFYRAQAALIVPNHDLPVVSEVSFWVIPWDLLLLALVVAAVAAVSRRRVWAAARALVGRTPPPLVDHSPGCGIIKPSLKRPRKAYARLGTALAKEKPKRRVRRLGAQARRGSRLTKDN